MPLRDHFRSPVNGRHTWDELHGGWPMMIVQQLFHILPAGYVSAPNVHLGRQFEVDVSTFEEEGQSAGRLSAEGGAALDAMPQPTLTLETDLPEQDEYEVLVYDAARGRRLVAAVEVVSPSNKDRPECRRAFVAKVAALLQQGVCVSVVDLVTVRQFNLYADLLELIGRVDPQIGAAPPHLYSVTVRGRRRPEMQPLLDVWFYPMTVGQPLPTLPIWLSADLRVLLPLEAS